MLEFRQGIPLFEFIFPTVIFSRLPRDDPEHGLEHVKYTCQYTEYESILVQHGTWFLVSFILCAIVRINHHDGHYLTSDSPDTYTVNRVLNLLWDSYDSSSLAVLGRN